MDFHGNNGHHIGYGRPRLKEAIKRQPDDLPFAPRRFTCKPAVALAHKLAEIARKLACVATGRYKTLSFRDAFTALSSAPPPSAASGCSAPGRPGRSCWVPSTCRPSIATATRSARGTRAASRTRRRAAPSGLVLYTLERGATSPWSSASQTAPCPTCRLGLWVEVRTACDDRGMQRIFDEIPTGPGKNGRMSACGHEGAVVPAILVLGNALGGAAQQFRRPRVFLGF